MFNHIIYFFINYVLVFGKLFNTLMNITRFNSEREFFFKLTNENNNNKHKKTRKF